ncbi:META domain-containing protein [Candidatus Leptofilum sp.]|uniref:META domain-containing protein n=1 Tax=Candidatus Leptofilum sp. TaxID=3241576 RepID=UPI003B5B9604
MKFHIKFAKMFTLSLLILFTIIACSPAGSGGDLEPDLDATPSLDNTDWVLDKFGPEGEETAVLPNTSITLNFADGGANGSAGCNNYFGEATQSDNALNFGAIGSTRMACPEAIMQQENAYLAALGTVNSFTLEDDQLTLQYEDGILLFTAGTPEEANDEAAENAKTLFVGSELVDCVGVAPQQCMQVKDSLDGEWTLFYDQIVGFTFEPGFEYELRVTETEIENPPADGSSLEVALVEIVSKTAVPTQLPEVNELIGSSWVLLSFGPNDNQTAVLPDTELTLNFDGEQINGSAGCNSYFAEVTVGEDGSLAVGLIGSTLMACVDDGISQQEADYLAALGQVTSYTLAEEQLRLHYEGGLLIFVASEAAAAEEVVDWETAVSILNSGDVVEIFQTHSLDVTLTLVDGRLIKTVEPAIDDIFTAVSDCGEPCSHIIMATE